MYVVRSVWDADANTIYVYSTYRYITAFFLSTIIQLTDTACPYPFEYNATDNLRPKGYNLSGDSPLIEFGEPVEYVCKDGMKFLSDPTVASQNSTCNFNNTWDPSPSFWSVCVPSKLVVKQ